MIHTVNGFGIVNKAEIDAFLKLFCFFDDSMDQISLLSWLKSPPAVIITLQQAGSKSGKEYIKAVYYHPAYLTYIQSTS